MRVLIVEDHPLSAAGICHALGNDHEVCGVLDNGEDVIPWLARHEVDLVILDLSLPRRNGAQVLADIQALARPPRVLVVTMHNDRFLGTMLQERGAAGLVMKDAPVGTLQEAVAEIGAGRTWFRGRHEVPMPETGPSATAIRLTPRQQEVLEALANGLSRKEMAANLQISESRVDEHLAALRRAFGAATNPELVRAAIGYGFLPPFPSPTSPADGKDKLGQAS